MTPGPGPRDLLFHGGTVFTAIGAAPVRAGVLVRAGRIHAIGPDADLRALAEPAAERIDLAGGLLLPGFVDSHVHPIFAGLQLAGCALGRSTDAAGYLAEVGRYAAEYPDRPWITGGGWSMEAFPGGTPSAALLDEVVPERPVYLPNRDYHGAWVNSRALALAGIGPDTPDPPDGRIERDASGTPSGMLHEGAAQLVAALVPEPTAADLDRALELAQRHLFGLGIIGWQDAIVGRYLGRPDILDTYLRNDVSGVLRARVSGALWWDRDRGLAQLPELLDRRARAAGGRRFTAGTVKIMLDGVAENFTAAMTVPYRDRRGRPTSNSGLSFVDPVALREYVGALHANGFQVHMHALGDRAVREALDAIEAAVTAHGPADLRHHLAHLQVVHPAEVPRFAALGVAANVQPLWACHEVQMDELTIPFLGGDLAARQYPFADLHRAGARLVAGSDWPVSSADPLWGAKVAVTRTAAGGEPVLDPFLPTQALGLAEILTAYTAGGAWLHHREHWAGTVAVGQVADLAVLDRDPFAGPPQDIDQARVLRTYVDGDLVYAA